ncbi:MAG: pantoate--beta-alanine ligase [Acidobacteriota bacterium]|nr:pantoate--beta-alanine ligase [Acidobacteriota bacterium]MDE3043845.1 pantoate--beta-alanine ligase [Acidobacteriota bacterium]MDE3108004.1 pantoate--beta-alanine ligase [Acidobacteriota bacterium]
MEVVHDLGRWRDAARATRARERTVGLVPTMGALHAGHLSLVRAARERGDVVFLTIFVNPRQFGDAADLARYPRTLDVDQRLAESAGVDVLVVPTLDEMWPDYPRDTMTSVHVAGLGDVLEGEGRPGHFTGVASVVAKLFAVTGPCRAYFGQKDFQQVAVVRQMVRDLALPVEVLDAPVVRDADGLALSSRNERLSSEGRANALALSRAIHAAARTRGPASVLRDVLRAELARAKVEVAYAEIVDPMTLRPLGDDARGVARALVAGVVEGVRLIDNGPVTLDQGE